MKHDCWPNSTHALVDDPAGNPCDQIAGSVSTGLQNLHLMSRVMGHMSSLAISLTILPVSKGSILLSAMGVSWESVLHWHRGLGAVAFLFVTIHMLLWWVKWGIEGSLTANIFFNIDTNKWLWVTPTWQHYENWSVLMAQIAWVFMLGMIIIALTCRRKMYRVFCLSHHVGVIFLMVGLIHAWSFWYFSLLGACLWWVDRMNRLVASARPLPVAFCNTVTGADQSNVTVLELYAPHIARAFVPGQYAVINVPDVSRHEWHPFTINVSHEAPDQNIVLCIKSCGTWTKELHSTAANLRSKCAALSPVLVGGVYGGLPTMRFSIPAPVVLVAGGIGVTPVVSVFHAALTAFNAGNADQQPSSITFVWAIRSLKLLDLPVARALLETAERLHDGDVVEVHIHLTGAAGAAAEQCGGEGDAALPVNSGAVRYHCCRPNLEKVFSSLPEGEDGFAFACGPTKLQECTVQNALRFGFTDVHTETFEF